MELLSRRWMKRRKGERRRLEIVRRRDPPEWSEFEGESNDRCRSTSVTENVQWPLPEGYQWLYSLEGIEKEPKGDLVRVEERRFPNESQARQIVPSNHCYRSFSFSEKKEVRRDDIVRSLETRWRERISLAHKGLWENFDKIEQASRDLWDVWKRWDERKTLEEARGQREPKMRWREILTMRVVSQEI